jgi:hypothetical protein
MPEMIWKKEDLHEVDWVKEQTKSALSSLQKEVLYTKNWDEVKFDVDTSLNYLKTLKDKKTYKEVMEKNPWATIMAVQILLKNKWFNVWKIDWILKSQWKATSNTMEAIKEFQRQNWLTDDGAPGPDTIKKLLEMFGNWWWNDSWGRDNEKHQQVKSVDSNVTPSEVEEENWVLLKDLQNLYWIWLWHFDGNENFIFNKWIEKIDSKWKYILINGKKMYELGDNKNGIYYKINNNWLPKEIYYGQYKNWVLNWWGREIRRRWLYQFIWQRKDWKPQGWQGTEFRPDWSVYKHGVKIK